MPEKKKGGNRGEEDVDTKSEKKGLDRFVFIANKLFLLIHSQTCITKYSLSLYIQPRKKKWKIKSIPSHIRNKFFSRFSMCVSKYSTSCIVSFWSSDLQAHWLRFDVRLIRSIYSIIEHRHTPTTKPLVSYSQETVSMYWDGIADVMNGRNSGNTHTHQPPVYCICIKCRLEMIL